MSFLHPANRGPKYLKLSETYAGTPDPRAGALAAIFINAMSENFWIREEGCNCR